VPGNLTEPQLEQIRRELRALIVESELRMTKWMFITAIGTVAVALLAAVPALEGARALLFVAGTAIQMYAVWRM
jgi:hypothetical protein